MGESIGRGGNELGGHSEEAGAGVRWGDLAEEVKFADEDNTKQLVGDERQERDRQSATEDDWEDDGRGAMTMRSGEEMSEEEKARWKEDWLWNMERIYPNIRREVFEVVDVEKIKELQVPYIEKIQEAELVDLYGAMRENLEDGSKQAAEYFAGILGLEQVPRVEIGKIEGMIAGGSTTRNGEMVMEIDPEKWEGDVAKMMGTIAHESWHFWQRNLQTKALSGSVWDVLKTESPELIDRVMMYAYNHANYKRSELDVDGYLNQLVEVEAWNFEKLGGKIDVLNGLENDRVREEYAWMFDRERRKEKMGERIREPLGKWDTGRMLDRLGVRNLQELEKRGYGEFDEKTAQAVVDELWGMLDLNTVPRVMIVDESRGLDDGSGFAVNWIGGDILLKKSVAEQADVYDNIGVIARAAWLIQQKQAEVNMKSEDGKLYRMINRYNQRLAEGDEPIEYPFLERESFARVLKLIMKEQKQMEDMERMHPIERLREKWKRQDVKKAYPWSSWSGAKYDARARR